MTRITNAMRAAITDAAVEKAGINKVLDAERAKRDAWIEAARIEVLGGPVKAAGYEKINSDAKAIHDSLPEDLKEYRSIVNTSSYLYLNLAGANLRPKFGELRIAPRDRVSIGAESPLCQQFYDLEAERSEAESKRDSIRHQVRATLEKFTTVKKLLEAWPEAKELLPATAPESKPQLPAVPVASLNALIGLPTE